MNYVRRQIQLQRCVFCETKTDNVLEHMREENHFKIPVQKVWDQPELVVCITYIFIYRANIDLLNSIINF